MCSSGPSSTFMRCSGVSCVSFWNSLGRWESRYKHNQSHFQSECMPTVPIEKQQPLFQQWDRNPWCQGRHSLSTCYLSLDTASQKCPCQTSESDPMLLTQKAVVSDHHMQVSRPGLLVMTLSEGGEISKLRWGAQSQAVSVWVPFLVVGVMHIICPLPCFIFCVRGCPVWWLCVCKQFVTLDFCLLFWLATSLLSWLMFYLQSDFLLPFFS